jgi:hypothetical protein
MVESLIQEVGVNPAALPSANEQATAVRNLGPGMSLPNPFAGVTDFGTKQVPIENEQGVVGYETQPMTALEWLSQNVDAANPIYQALVGHTSTSITPYTDVNGNQFYHIAGKTGGPDRERYAQMYAVQGDQLVPVGEGQFYKGEHPDQAFKDFVGMAAGLLAAPVLGPYASAIGNALGITNAAVAQVVGQGIINTSIQVAQGVPIETAIKQNVASSIIPNVVGNPIIDNAVKAAAGAQIMGGNVENAVVNSLIASGAQSLAGDLSITGDRTIDSGLVSGGTSIAQALATGGDPGQSFIQGFTRGASTAINQDEARAARAASGAGFVGEYEDLSGAGPVDYVMGERDPALVQAGFFDTTRGILQSGLAELGKSWLSAGQQLGIAPERLQRAIDYLKVIEEGGEALISEDVKQQQQAFINQIYATASNPNATTTEIAKAVIEATLNNPLGSLTLVSKELAQELPQLLIPGKAAALVGSFALNIAESAGNQALQKIDELRAAYPNLTTEQLVAAARNDAGVAGAVTAAMSLIPGAGSKLLNPLKESFNEFLEEGLTTYLLTGDKSKALGNAVLGGVLGGKTTATVQTGEDIAAAGQNIAQQGLPSLGTITVRSTPLPADETSVAGGTLAIEPVVAARTGGQQVIPSAPSTAVVISTDPASNTALVIDNNGSTKIVGATDVATGSPVTQGQSLTITVDNQLTSSTPVQQGVEPVTSVTKPTEVPRRAAKDYSAYSNMFADERAETNARRSELEAQFATSKAEAEIKARTFQGTVYPTVEARNEAMNSYIQSIGEKTLGATPSTSSKTAVDTNNQVANLSDVVNLLTTMGITPTNSMVADLTANNATNAQVIKNLQNNVEVMNAVNSSTPATTKVEENVDAGAKLDTGIQAGNNVETNLGTTTSATSGTNIKTGEKVGTESEAVVNTKPDAGTGTNATVPTVTTEVKSVQDQIALPDDVAFLLRSMGIAPTQSLIAELTRNNATNQEVLTKLRNDPAVAAVVESLRTPKSNAAIVIAVDPNNNTALVIDNNGNTSTVIATDQATKATLTENQIVNTATLTPTGSTITETKPETFAQPDLVAALINSRFQSAGKVATQQDIQSLKDQAANMGVDLNDPNVGFTQQYQRWAALVNDTALGIPQRVTPTVTPTTQPSVTETIDLTGTTGRVNIDTVSPVDTTGQDTTFLDTTPTYDTAPAIDTGPALDTGPAEETTPTYGEDDDIIRFLGLDRIEEQPVERAEPVAEPEDTTPGAVAGPADVATEEQLAIAPRPVYTPKPGTRVVDTGSSILPTRVQLSEGMGDDVEGTGEEEQQPVWNVRSLKLRRALGI